MPRHPSTSVSIVALVAALAAIPACGDKQAVEKAKHSLYDADFAIVYAAALDATRNLYPNLDDAPGAGAIRTSWHQVTFANNQDDLANPAVVANGNPTMGQVNGATGAVSPAASAAGMPTRLAYKRYFIRFDVSVIGGRPWRVKIVGHASEWEPGAAMPVELHGVARPPWLEPRTDALTLAIYNKIKSHAVPMKEEEKVDPESLLPKTDVTMFDKLPPEAAKRLAHVRDACMRRQFDVLRGDLADDVQFSLGADGSADAAIAIWQADPDAIEQMAKTINAQCAPDGDKVRCPAGMVHQGAYQLTLELRGTEWKVAAFLKAE